MRLRLTFLLTLAFANALACDFCGGGNIGLDLSVLSASGGNFAGMQTSATHYKATSVNGQSDWLLNWTFKGSYAPLEQLRLQAFMPVYLQINQDMEFRRSGLGDILFMLSWDALDRMNMEAESRHKIVLGGGVELPSGKYEFDPEGEIETIPFGSKSWDFLGSAAYIFSIKHYTLSVSGLGKYNLTNKDDYRYGNSLETVMQHSYRFRARDGSLFPFIGWKFNASAKDVSRNFYRDFTGGIVFSQLVGLHWNYYQYDLSFYTGIPLYQNLNDPDVETGAIISIQFIYNF